jgi:hypothetical protein
MAIMRRPGYAACHRISAAVIPIAMRSRYQIAPTAASRKLLDRVLVLIQIRLRTKRDKIWEILAKQLAHLVTLTFSTQSRPGGGWLPSG